MKQRITVTWLTSHIAKAIKHVLAAGFLALLFVSVKSHANDTPAFLADTLPTHAISEILTSWQAMQDSNAQIDAKTRELIALAVAAQIPCHYCVHAHSTRLRSKLGASEAELKEAVAIAGYIRLFSTVFNGNDYEITKFKSEFDGLMIPTTTTDAKGGIERHLNNYLAPK